MKPGVKLLFAAGGAAVILLLWLLWREHGHLQVARQRLESQQQQTAALRTERVRWQKELETFIPAQAPSAVRPKSAGATAPMAVPATPPAPQRAASRPWLTRLFAQSPNLHRLYLEAYRSELEFEHALTFASLGLTAEERGRVIGILARDMELRTDIAAAARAGEMGSANTSIRTFHVQRERETSDALRTLLGERYETWQMDRRVMIPFVSEAAMHLHRTSTPLSLAQSETMTELARKGLSARREGNGVVLPTMADYATFAEEAGRVLSPEQGVIVRRLVEQLAARRQLDQLQSPKRK